MESVCTAMDRNMKANSERISGVAGDRFALKMVTYMTVNGVMTLSMVSAVFLFNEGL